jgi:hypothetical protein
MAFLCFSRNRNTAEDKITRGYYRTVTYLLTLAGHPAAGANHPYTCGARQAALYFSKNRNNARFFVSQKHNDDHGLKDERLFDCLIVLTRLYSIIFFVYEMHHE